MYAYKTYIHIYAYISIYILYTDTHNELAPLLGSLWLVFSLDHMHMHPACCDLCFSTVILYESSYEKQPPLQEMIYMEENCWLLNSSSEQ